MEFVGLAWPIYLLVAALGVVVGTGELVSRYPDAPRAALSTTAGIFYLFVNGVAAAAALAVGAVYAPPENTTDYSNPELLNLILVSGFGSLAFFRAKLVTIRVGKSDVGVGPSFVLEIILASADRAVARARAAPRAKVVIEIMKDVSFEIAKVVLPTYCFNLMQNVPVEDQQRAALEIEALANADMPEKAKVLNLGLILLNILGEDVLRTATENLQSEFAGESQSLREVEAHMATIDFDLAADNLVPLCANLAKMEAEERTELEFEITRLRNWDLTDQTRRYLFGLMMIRAFGSAVVSQAIDSIGDSIRANAPDPQAEPPSDTNEEPHQ